MLQVRDGCSQIPPTDQLKMCIGQQIIASISLQSTGNAESLAFVDHFLSKCHNIVEIEDNGDIIT